MFHNEREQLVEESNYLQPLVAPRGHQPADPPLPGQDLGGPLHQGARPPLQVLHPRQLCRPHRHGIHPDPHRETVSEEHNRNTRDSLL